MSKRLLTYLSIFCFTATHLPSLQGDVSSPIIASYDRMTVGNIEIIAEQLPPNASFDSSSISNKLKTKT
ncbi:MAG: hypothetical protein JSS09_00330, partial [Verrucomicrobia bacterium]|nr:hypothetical protein [Verrucomicrobiota bacterium]